MSNMFNIFDEMLEELYDEYTMDEIMDALEELAEIYNKDMKHETEHEEEHGEENESFECDGDCANCVYGQDVDDSDAYQYGKVDEDDYRAFETDLMNGIEGALETANVQNKLWGEYKKAQNSLEKALDEYDNKIDDAMFGDCDCDDEEHNDKGGDSINHPSHYVGKIEVIDFIEDKNLDYNLGNCVKYLARAGKKHELGMSIQEKKLQDLKKARWYLDREISTLEAEL